VFEKVADLSSETFHYENNDQVFSQTDLEKLHGAEPPGVNNGAINFL